MDNIWGGGVIWKPYGGRGDMEQIWGYCGKRYVGDVKNNWDDVEKYGDHMENV